MTGDLIKVPSHRRKPGTVASAPTERVIKLAITKQSMSDGVLMRLTLAAAMPLLLGRREGTFPCEPKVHGWVVFAQCVLLGSPPKANKEMFHSTTTVASAILPSQKWHLAIEKLASRQIKLVAL